MTVIVRVVVGALASVVGLVWLLQGLNVLPGSFMTGNAMWAVIGLIVGGAGVALLISGVNRMRHPRP